MSAVTLSTPLRTALGGKANTLLDKHLGLQTVRDLLRYYPRRYDVRGELTDLARLAIGDDVTVMAEVQTVTGRPLPYRFHHNGKPKHLLELMVTDGQQALRLTFFNQQWRQKELKPGVRGLFAGRVREFRGKRELSNPQYTLFDADSDAETVDSFAGTFIPIYPATSEITTWQIGRCVRQALDLLGELPDPLPPEILATHGLMDLRGALEAIHRPNSREQIAAARDRLTWDEALTLQVTLAQRRASAADIAGVPRRGGGGLLTAFDAALPFQLTGGQRVIGTELADDLAGEHPMYRLLQGEVGSGKTVVALRAMLQVVDSGGQAALLAPTEVLAAQHYRSIVAMLGPLAEGGMLGGDEQATRVVLLTGSMSVARRRQSLLDAAAGSAGIVIGTHALLEDKVQFAELGLAVVDEQHRFGVEQRAALTDKAGFTPPHVLVMTATPIPRTVAMTVFGDLDVSTLRDLPEGRIPIQSTVVPAAERPDWLDRAWRRVREEVEQGRQAYVVCPRIGGEPESAMQEEPPGDGSESPSRAPLAVAAVAAQLTAGPLDGLRLFILHGRLPGDEKDDVMQRFAAGEIDVLVATTVIEVGVDVANASLMVVMDAERFGVSQLHQLRGRIGRGSVAGVCLFVTDAPAGSRARERVDGVAATADGFELARLDLENRREGDVLGAIQSGRRSSLKLLSVLRDEEVITQARTAADTLVTADPALDKHQALSVAVAALVSTEQASYLDKS
ncbi:MAG: ATP-dependent DNA helicase RecG [Geodermatophilaceae bacterium]|nr:ATP-dependent DNA helicase RecG [Geodermatophilaceae bacterium]